MTRGVMENPYLKSLATQFGLWNWEEDLVQNLYTIYDLQFIDCLAMGLRWKQMTKSGGTWYKILHVFGQF